MDWSVGQTENSPDTAPAVSVVIPAYNRAHLIGRAIDSVLAQTFRDFELVVVDDASTDNLAGVLSQIADCRLRCVGHACNRGAAAARNTGIAAARGELIAFLDSDDAWYPDKLACQVAALRGQTAEIAGHVCAYDCVKTGYRPRQIAPNWIAQPFQRAVLFGCTCGPGTTLLCRRSIFTEIGLFDEHLRRLEDWDWLLRLAGKGYRLLASPRVLALVEVGSRASRRDIEAALQLIGPRHRAAAARESAVGRRIFDAAFHIERAAAAFGEGAFADALREVLRGIACYPLQGIHFYWHLAERAIRLFSRGRSNGLASSFLRGRPPD